MTALSPKPANSQVSRAPLHRAAEDKSKCSGGQCWGPASTHRSTRALYQPSLPRDPVSLNCSSSSKSCLWTLISSSTYFTTQRSKVERDRSGQSRCSSRHSSQSSAARRIRSPRQSMSAPWTRQYRLLTGGTRRRAAVHSNRSQFANEPHLPRTLG